MKNKVLKLLFLIPILAGLTACQKYELGNPAASTQANFTYTLSNNGNAPCVLTIENKSLNASGYFWEFSNGVTSTEENPVVEFNTPGLFTVKLTCKSENNVYYSNLIKTVAVNIKDSQAGAAQVLYFTTRSSSGGGAYFVILNGDAPIIQEFEQVPFSRAYSLAVDSASQKVFIADFNLKVIYRFDADGKNPEKILDATVPGQEIVDAPEGLMVLNNKLYWGRPGGIYRCNLDGSNPEPFLNTNGLKPEYPIDMQYNPADDRIYFVNDRTEFSGGLWSVKSDGTGLTELIADIDGTAMEVNPATGKVYLAIYGDSATPISENGIYVCNLDGSALTKIGDYGSKATWGIAIDHKREKLFWGYKISNSMPDGKIVRSNLDGSGVEDWLTGVSPHAVHVAWIKL